MTDRREGGARVTSTLRGVGACLVGMLCIAAPAVAQDVNRVAVSGGYSLLRQTSSFTFPVGWYVDMGTRVAGSVWLVGHGTGGYDSGEGVSRATHLVAGGVRVARDTGSLRPFGHILAGAMRESVRAEVPEPRPMEIRIARTDGAMELGGGVDVGSGHPFSVRVGIGYLRRFVDGGERNSAIRAQVGLVLGF